MKTLLNMLPKGYTLAPFPAVTYSEEEWARIPDSAKVLGCTPDYNAWTLSINPSPDVSGDLERVRTASGHLHIGWTENVNLAKDVDHLRHCNDLVRQLDWYLGVWSLSQDSDPTRRNLYGKAGACRYKPYGVEYRVLSNFWLTTKTRRRAVWDRMQQAIWDMSEKYYPETYSKYNNRVVDAINNSQPSLLGNANYVCNYPLVKI